MGLGLLQGNRRKKSLNPSESINSWFIRSASCLSDQESLYYDSDGHRITRGRHHHGRRLPARQEYTHENYYGELHGLADERSVNCEGPL